MKNEIEKRKLPTIQQLYNEDADLVRQNDLNIILNQEPKKEWVKDHPIAKNVKYLPIERIEWMLTNIYIKWRVEILNTMLIANSSVVTIRLHYLDPITGEWDWQDGIGAAPLQTDKDAGATDWQKIKSDAVMKSVPAAESYAIKDAAEKLGKLFGKDLNRADKIMYDTLIGKFEATDITAKTKEVIALIAKLPTQEQIIYKEILKEKREAGELSLTIINNMIEELCSMT